MMDHLDMDLIVDHEFGKKLFINWIESDTELEWKFWLKRMVMHRAVGGASNKDVDYLKKTIMILIDEIEKENGN